MNTILVSEFKAKCIRLLKLVRKTKKPLVVTLRGKPLARVEPIVQQKKRVRLRALKGWMENQGRHHPFEHGKDWLTQ